jgi:2-dehydro-3-deoxygluconokinase
MIELRESGAGFSAGVAGDAFNTAARLAERGVEVAHAQHLGRDVFRERIRQEASARGVQMLGRDLEDRTNGIYIVVLDEAGQCRFQYHRAGSAAGETLVLSEEDEIAAALARARLVYVTGITLAISSDPDRLVGRLAEAGTDVALGLNLREGLHRRRSDGHLVPVESDQVLRQVRELASHSTVVFGAVEEWARLGPGAAARLAHAREDLSVVVTEGRRGATLFAGGASVSISPDTTTRQVDGSGAGDALAAGFLSAWLEGLPGDDCLRAGVSAGAAAVAHSGALPPLSLK